MKNDENGKLKLQWEVSDFDAYKQRKTQKLKGGFFFEIMDYGKGKKELILCDFDKVLDSTVLVDSDTVGALKEKAEDSRELLEVAIREKCDKVDKMDFIEILSRNLCASNTGLGQSGRLEERTEQAQLAVNIHCVKDTVVFKELVKVALSVWANSHHKNMVLVTIAEDKVKQHSLCGSSL